MHNSLAIQARSEGVITCRVSVKSPKFDIYSLLSLPLLRRPALPVANRCLAGPVLASRAHPGVEYGVATAHLEAAHGDAFNRLADQLFDIFQCALLFAADKGDGVTFVAGACGAADAVDVVLRQKGEVDVDHMLQALNIEAASGHLGCDQYLYLIVLEIGDGAAA